MSDDSAIAPDEISAGPTKAFFVTMITRDIELQPAIVDLVDNSVDGARALRGEGGYEGLLVELECSRDEFVIRDNCGGIPLETARRYAFRFGRDENTPGIAHTVGQFGVGMKRALFKLGSRFTVESVATSSSFYLEVDVPEWAARENDWVFPLSRWDDTASTPEADTYTEIRVTALHEDVSEDLSLEAFAAGLLEDLRLKHRLSIARGLCISVNGAVIEADPLTILRSGAITPGKRTKVYATGRPAPVEVTIIAGIGPSDPQSAGWYIYCNSRLVLGPDRSRTTGWGEGRGKRGIPRWHTQFSRFRGFVFFESDRADQLPLTTTKVGIDGDSSVWRGTKPIMVEMMRSVIDYLNAIDWERPQLAENVTGELEAAVLEAKETLVDELPESEFVAPSREDVQPPEQLSSIQYRQPIDRIATAKELLEVQSNAEVGVLTFEYFMDAES